MKIIVWIIASIMAVFLIFIIVILILYRNGIDFHKYPSYIDDYFNVIGLPKDHLYSTVVDVYGEPLNIVPFENNEYWFTAQYDGIEFVIYGSVANAARISNPEIRFGDKQIGVGSTRDEIKNAYKDFTPHGRGSTVEGGNYMRGTLNTYNFGIQVIDGLTWLDFYFNKNEIVEKIVMYNNGP